MKGIPSSSITTPSSNNSSGGNSSIKPSLRSSQKTTEEQQQESTIIQNAKADQISVGRTSTGTDFAARVSAAAAIGGAIGGIGGAAAAGMSQAMAMQSGMMKAEVLKQAASGISELGSLGKLFEGIGKKNKGNEEESNRRIASRDSWGQAGAKDA